MRAPATIYLGIGTNAEIGALQWAREVSEHPAVVEKVARYVVIHRELKSEPRGPRRSALVRESFALKTTLMP